MHPHNSVGNWLMEKAKRENHGVMELLTLTMWSIWVSRNNLIFRGGQSDPMVTSRRATAMVSEYQDVNKPESRVLNEIRRWSPPPTDLKKINTDAAFVGNSW